MIDLKGKTALVTGGARGIGKSIAETLAKAGAAVAVADINQEVIDGTVAELKASGCKAFGVLCDVTDADSVNEAVKAIDSELGNVDILVNNAGITQDTLFMRMDADKWQKVIDVNLTGAFNVTKAVIRQMARNRFGRIINISSVVGLIGNAGQANYSASKAGLLGFTKSIAKEYGQRNVTSNAVAPGFIETAMTGILEDDVKNEFLRNIPMKRMGVPEDVANIVLFLSSELASYVTGQVVNVDGGMVM